jgi:hypothetical protein
MNGLRRVSTSWNAEDEPILIVLVLDFNAIDCHRSAAGRSSFLNQL